MELTINNLIKIIIAVFVIVVVIFGIYSGMRNYILPYFSGLGFEEPKIDMNSGFGKILIKEENKIARLDNENYLVFKNQKTDVYFKEQKIWIKEIGVLGIDRLDLDEEIGSLDNEGKITINPGFGYEELNGAYKFGKEIYKIGGVDE